MTTFWILTLLLVLLCMALVIVPVIMPDRGSEALEDVSDKETNVAYFREQLSELETQVRAGLVSEAEAVALKTELEKKLLTDVEDTREQAATAQQSSPFAGVAMALMIPVLALPLYFKLGAATELDVTEKLMNPNATPEQTLSALEDWSAKRPDNVQAMYMLGSRYLADGDTDKSVSTFRRLYEQTDGHFQIAEQLAQALYVSREKTIDDEIRRLITSTLGVDEMSPTALRLKGIDAFRQENYREAIQTWTRALSVEPDSWVRDEMSAGIRNAREALGQPVAEVRVNVSLSEDLAELPADARVIVFARETGGSMPLAAVPMSVSELPREIVLDDSSAMMMHGGSLGDIQSLDLIGRISLTGDVSSPDYETLIQAIAVNDSAVVQMKIAPAG